jgi:hypothetical protein
MDAALHLVEYMYHTKDWSIQYTRSKSTESNQPIIYEKDCYTSSTASVPDGHPAPIVGTTDTALVQIERPAPILKSSSFKPTARTIEERLIAGTPARLPNDPSMYCDADHGGDRETRRSTSGQVIIMNGGPISWGSRLQKLCAQSSAESEIYAVTDAVKEALHIRLLCEECGIRAPGIPMTIWEDNNACIHLGHNLRGSKAAKHFEIRLRLLNEHIQNGNIEFARVDTKDQMADPFTKPLPFPAFSSFRSQLMVDRTE